MVTDRISTNQEILNLMVIRSVLSHDINLSACLPIAEPNRVIRNRLAVRGCGIFHFQIT